MITFLSRCSTTLTTLFLLVQLLPSPPPISATTDTPVLDIDGNPVDSTSQYHIFPALAGAGGIRLKPRPDKIPFACPLFSYIARFFDPGIPAKFIPTELGQKNITVQTDLKISFVSPLESGLPVKFIPSKPGPKNITLYTDLKISFVSPHLRCPPIWSLTSVPGTAGIYVTTGVPDNRNCKVTQGTKPNALFKIEKRTSKIAPHVYTITYSAPPPEIAFGELAILDEDGTGWLGLTFSAQPKPLPVYFQKSN